ncbi:hypothetical protein OQA88_6951 [Cercophora sp. LCS_1]
MDPLTITTSTLSIIGLCVKGLDALHKYWSDAQQAELNLRQLTDECTTIEAAVVNLRILYRKPDRLPPSLANHDDVRISLTNCERMFNVLLEKLDPILSLIQRRGATDRLSICARISVVWNRDEVEFFRQRLQGQVVALDFLLGVVQYHLSRETNDKIDAVLEILQSSDWKQRLGRSKRDADTLVSSYDKESSLFYRPSAHPDDIADSILGDENFSFDDESVNTKAYRRSLARHSRKAPSSSFSQLLKKTFRKGSEQPSEGIVTESFEEIILDQTHAPETLTIQHIEKWEETLRSWVALRSELRSMKHADSVFDDVRLAKMKQADDLLSELRINVSDWERKTSSNAAVGEELRWVLAVTQDPLLTSSRNK